MSPASLKGIKQQRERLQKSAEMSSWNHYIWRPLSTLSACAWQLRKWASHHGLVGAQKLTCSSLRNGQDGFMLNVYSSHGKEHA